MLESLTSKTAIGDAFLTMSNNHFTRSLGNPWNARYLLVVVVASVIAAAIACARNATVAPASVIFPLVSAILAALAWNRLSDGSVISNHEDSPTELILSKASRTGWWLLALSILVAGIGLAIRSATALHWILLFLPYAIIVLYVRGIHRHPYSLLVIAPLLFGLLILDTALLLGNLAGGGYPSVYALLLVFIILVTRELERRTPISDNSDEDPHVHILHRKAMAWLSIVFFLFGVIGFWPWLGKIYSDTYFWILVAGVLVPLLYLWGRLRQPRRQNSYVALQRFNRIVPYLGLILLVAIAFG